ncbi:MAG: hypothetical protein R3E32_17720 [Chitinophagales bacterium]
MKLLEKYPISILLLCSFAVTFLLWGDIIWNANDYLFAPYGDGIKNYYGPAYYVKYGGRWNFNGMGYPFGSYLMYVDAMPSIAMPLHWINESIVNIEGYTIGIVNWCMIFSIIPCILFLFLILRHYRLPVWYAMITALLIAHLSPQFHRFLGHYALAILTVIPLSWYILLRQENSKHPYRWAVLQIIALLFFAFIHAYYLLIDAVFILAYALVYFLQKYFRKQLQLSHFVSLILSAIVPIVVFKVFQIVTDPTTDLHTSPFGFFFYHAEPRSILFSTDPPLGEFWKLFYKNHPPKFEGYVYIGFISVLAVLFTLIKGFKYVVKRQWAKMLRPVLPANLSTAIWASVIVLLYSMCIPFEQGFAFLLDYLPQLRQFRSLGRFAWVFYYVFTVYTAFYFFLIFRRMSIKGVKTIAATMLFLAFGIWAMEGYYLIKSKQKYTRETNVENHDFYGKTINYKDILIEKGHQVSDFQAMMVFPYFNIGSEKLYVSERGAGGLYFGCKVSYQTGLPMNSIFVGRYSILQSLKMGQLMSNPLIEKQILKEYPNDKPLLLVTHGKNFMPDEQRLLQKAKLIYQNDNETLYELPLSAFDNELSNAKQIFETQKDSLFHFNTPQEYWSTDSVNNVVIQGFEDGNFSGALFGDKAIHETKGELMLFEGKLPNAKEGQQYIASVWVKSDDKYAAFPDFSYKQFNLDNAEVDQVYFDPKERLDIYKDWVRADHVFTLQNADNPIRIVLIAEDIVADELLIRPLSTNVYYPLSQSNRFMLNGYVID